ncbi:hypothetical protein [Paraburkholderia youngii]|uniref:hypothetical protein n=1 Tax=Paraburkholderia youngii TaxID=2782701 RepID=UPI0015901106|nr:hypothetical protein [Paraburkholderia youngii]NUX56006.1 hypothetical protein [Paraburkholderia youngii]
MRVRAVAAALAVWCVSEAALAAGYAEVWNPPEASGHVTRQAHARNQPGAAKVKVKAATRSGVKPKADAHAQQATRVRHAVPHVASAGAGHGGKLAAHGGGVKVAASSQNRSHATVTARAAKHAQPHVQLAHAKPAPGKVVHADFAAAHTARLHVDKVGAKPAVSRANPVRPAVQTSPDTSANVSDIAPMGSAPNPATASSGSLPPIIH